MILYFIIEDLKILFTEKLSQTQKELSDLQLQLRKSLNAELEKLENECYLA